MPSDLTQLEATAKLKTFGFNEIVEGTKTSPFRILFRQVEKNFVVYLLAASALISILVGKTFTSTTIIAVIFLVIITGFIQEYKAEKSIEGLRKMIMPITIVFRDGKKKEIPSRELVPGDIVILGNGEKIPADCELLEQHELRTNESALTGESKEIAKKAVTEQTPTAGNSENTQETELNKIFMGTYIVNGRCTAKVLHTGMNTQFGKIAHLISTADKQLPLQNKVNHIAKYMVIIALISAFSTGLLVLLRTPVINSDIIVEVLILMVAMSVSAFPEGFPVVLITTLAIGAKRMSEKNAVVSRMSIIETLGETTVICSDKTGTITKGEMTVKFIFTGNYLYEVEGSGYTAHGNILKNKERANLKENSDLKQLIEASILCTDAEIERTGTDNDYKALGTPTEAALLILGAKIGVFKENFDFERKEEFPFNSERKMMSVLVDTHKSFEIYAKGAPEILLPKCTKMLKQGNITDFDEESRKKVRQMQEEMSKTAYRTLAVACKTIQSPEKNYTEDNLIFLGLLAMEDSPRVEVAGAIQMAQKAGIRVIMITGDSKDTAVSIGKQIGIEDKVIEGFTLDDMTDDELSVAIKDVAIFARVKPEHKIRIVKVLKALGEVVAMTGDGVNDAPALKEAHIGIAMGKNGTDVSRAAADLVLKDDNFATIVNAIAEGRTVFNNLRKFTTYELSCNMAEILILFLGVLFAPLFGWQTPLLFSIQILFMNLVTDNLPAITLGLNPTSIDIMDGKPRKNAGILNKVLIKLLITTSIITASLTLLAYTISFNILGFHNEMSRTTALVALIVIEIATAFSFRSFRKRTLNRSPFVNKYLVYASIASLALTFVIVYTPLHVAFETVPINLIHWAIAFGTAIVGLVVHDLIKSRNNLNEEYITSTL